MTRIASIDCGTNTVLLLVADIAPAGAYDQALIPVEDRLEITRLGQGLDQSGRLSEEAMERTLQALISHAARARALGAVHLVAAGTEALRAANNGAEFLHRASVCGVPLRVLSGDEEARLSFLSAGPSAALPGETWRSVLDIGGGSTELIVGRGAGRDVHIEAYRSIPIGSVRLTERLLHGDPPSAAEQAALRAEIDAALAALPQVQGELIGVAGTVTTLAAMHLALDTYDGARVDGLRLPLSALRALTEQLGRTPLSERRRLTGLDPRRADVIYAGAMILLRVAERAPGPAPRHVIVSDRGIRWGLLQELAEQLKLGTET